MKNVVALVLAGGKMGDYGVLTQNRAKGALTFAGIYRIIDFALSNLVNSGIDKIGLIIQYLPSSLIEHVGVGHPWDLDNYGKHLKIMPPFVGMEHTAWYKGTADALAQNRSFVRDTNAEHVIILSGEHVYNLDYREVLETHIARDADITLVTKQLPAEQLSRRYGYIESDENFRVTAYHEKPATPIGNAVSTGIYVFKTSVLTKLLEENQKASDHNLAKDILQRHIAEYKAYEFQMQGCWEYLDSVRDYFDLQFRLLSENKDLLRHWNIITNLKFRGVGNAAAASFGKDAKVSGSMISANCRIEGEVIDSILSPGVYVGKGARVTNSILMHDCKVEGEAMLEGVISDRDVAFSRGCKVGIPGSSPYTPIPLENGEIPLTLIGKGAIIGPQVIIPSGVQVRPGKNLADQTAARAEV